MTTTRHSRTRLKRAALLSLLPFTTAFVVPPKGGFTRGDQLSTTASSVRKTINFGPQVVTDSYTVDNPSSALKLWNVAAPTLSIQAADLTGRQLARAFIESLHPSSEFRYVQGYLSKHSNVFHAYFLQQHNGIDIANANLNVNINLHSNEILSYGDSSFAKHNRSVHDTVATWKDNVQRWAGNAAQAVAASGPGQVVFGHQQTEPERGVIATSLEHMRTNDPRDGLLTFLTIQSPSLELTNVLLSAPRHLLVQRMTLERVHNSIQGGGEDFIIDNVPSAVEPVKVLKTYIHDGNDLKLAWKYEIRTNDNHYEVYMSASHDVAPGNEDTLLAVDWVRDYRPTGGELGIEALSMAPTFSSLRHTKGVRRGARTSMGGLRTADIDDGVEVDLETVKAVQPTYKVFPWGVNAPDVSKRETLAGKAVELDDKASPAGWHTVPSSVKGGKGTSYQNTRGNNVIAQDNPDGGSSMNGYRPSGGEKLDFEFPLHWPKAGIPLEPSTYINASVTQLFYTNNEIHDLYYRYGFNEEAGNFQEYNFGRGGLGGDAVQANAQDGSGTNNANFATPPDGSRPRMRMYTWTGQQPYRDGDFEAGIVIHEYSHGLSTRLTGGPANSGCLGWGEAGGMGEGWGDFLSLLIREKYEDSKDFTMGEWASGRVGGIRNYPYSTNQTTNLDTYATLDKGGYWGVHAIGEVWAEMLYTVSVNLIKKHGFSKDLWPPLPGKDDKAGFYNDNYTKTKVPKHGNTLIFQLVLDGMKLQPCRPSFADARDAILAADKALTGGDNACEIWNGFAARGLGPDAKLVGGTPWGGGLHKADTSVPAKCRTKKTA